MHTRDGSQLSAQGTELVQHTEGMGASSVDADGGALCCGSLGVPHQLLLQTASADSRICMSPSITSTKWFIRDMAQSCTVKMIWGLNGFPVRDGSVG